MTLGPNWALPGICGPRCVALVVWRTSGLTSASELSCVRAHRFLSAIRHPRGASPQTASARRPCSNRSGVWPLPCVCDGRLRLPRRDPTAWRCQRSVAGRQTDAGLPRTVTGSAVGWAPLRTPAAIGHAWPVPGKLGQTCCSKSQLQGLLDRPASRTARSDRSWR